MSLGHGNKRIVTDGLVIYLDAANPKSYPGTGNTWFDISGKQNHATIHNSPTHSNGRFLWNGTTQYAAIPFNANDFTFNVGQTVMIALEPTEADAARRNPYNQAYGGGGTWTHEASGAFNYYYGTAGINTTPYAGRTSTGLTVANNEVAICATSRSGLDFFRWFKNEQILNGAGSYAEANTGTQPIWIADGYAGNFQGYIDTVLVYNRGLSNTEIQQNFDVLRGRYGL